MIDKKVKQIKKDIQAIQDGEMLAIYNKPTDEEINKDYAIKLQRWRIEVLKGLKKKTKTQLSQELIELEEKFKVKPDFETAVVIDLYRIALGVL